MEYYGVMRFLFQDVGSKLATKCIRVSSEESTDDVIEKLIEKFRPDMKMLTTPVYNLYEVDSNGGKGLQYNLLSKFPFKDTSNCFYANEIAIESNCCVNNDQF